jgi:hypothetical protein
MKTFIATLAILLSTIIYGYIIDEYNRFHT